MELELATFCHAYSPYLAALFKRNKPTVRKQTGEEKERDAEIERKRERERERERELE